MSQPDAQTPHLAPSAPLQPLPPLPAEQLLIDCLPDWGGLRGLVVSPGRAQLADHLVAVRGMPYVAAWYVDLHDAAAANAVCAEGVHVLCGSDLPDSEHDIGEVAEALDVATPKSETPDGFHFDLIAMPVLRRGEVEMTRELMQQAHQRLAIGGYLAVSVDNPKDQWLHEQMQALFDKVTSHRTPQGCAYWGKKTKPLKKLKDFSCQFAFRDEDSQRMIQVLTRPSVFSHRRLDPGARQLMLTAEIGPTDNVLEMGCGAGAVSLAAAFETSGTVFAVDANARAIECTQRGAQLNGLENVQAILNADGDLDLPVAIDLALANPPYFGDDRISQHFVDTAVGVLRPGGALLVVTKNPEWYGAYFEALQLEDIVIFESSKYYIACGRKPA